MICSLPTSPSASVTTLLSLALGGPVIGSYLVSSMLILFSMRVLLSLFPLPGMLLAHISHRCFPSIQTSTHWWPHSQSLLDHPILIILPAIFPSQHVLLSEIIYLFSIYIILFVTLKQVHCWYCQLPYRQHLKECLTHTKFLECVKY